MGDSWRGRLNARPASRGTRLGRWGWPEAAGNGGGTTTLKWHGGRRRADMSGPHVSDGEEVRRH
jgi:hypothetical protein